MLKVKHWNFIMGAKFRTLSWWSPEIKVDSCIYGYYAAYSGEEGDIHISATKITSVFVINCNFIKNEQYLYFACSHLKR